MNYHDSEMQVFTCIRGFLCEGNSMHTSMEWSSVFAGVHEFIYKGISTYISKHSLAMGSPASFAYPSHGKQDQADHFV